MKRQNMNDRENELIQSAKNGDNRAFDELIRLNDRRILQVAHGIMGNMQDAYDAYSGGSYPGVSETGYLSQ